VTTTESLLGQAVVITGSSSGIGRAIALELARAGADVLVHAGHNRAGAEEVADSIRSLGRDASVVVADLTDIGAQDKLVDAAWKWRPVDVWINNAGADVLTGEAADWSFEVKLAALWKVDVVSTLRLSRAAGNRMRARGHGIILNMGWDQAETGMAGDSGELFATAKGAVMAATRSLAKSLAPEWQERAQRESLLGRWGQPENVARVACFLASPAAEFINGQIIHINGGRAD
jgi:3-oxoacyl-[acyl-carrier protein] reductase